MENKKVLVVEDDVFIRDMVELALQRAGAQVDTASDGDEGFRRFFEFRPDLVITDIMMPRTDGWELLSQIRKLADTPVIMLTAVSSEEDVIRGLDMGAVDYVTKPFSVKVLLARARSALRTTASASDSPSTDIFDDGYLYIDPEYRQVKVNRAPIHLTDTEFRLLSYLLINKGRILTSAQILGEVWGIGYEDNPQYVHVYVARLRKKLEVDPKQPIYLQNVPNVGYRFSSSHI